MSPDEYASLDATDLAALISEGETSPQQIADAAAARHRSTHEQINAVVEWYDDPSGVQAGGETGPLAGVPFLRKDYGSAEAGRLVEMGSRLAAGNRAAETGIFVQRLRSAGVQIMGRSTVPEFIQHGTTESIAQGITRNPHNPNFSAGGSSGGSGAAVAAGVVPVAHASDCAGSIRIPAAACGLVGLKPGRRRVPWESGGWDGLAEEFVLTRSLRDAVTCLDVLGDGDYLPALERPTRIALSTEHWAGAPHVVDPDVVAAVESAAHKLSAFGHDITPIAAPVDNELLGTTWHTLFSRYVAADAQRVAAAAGRSLDASMLEPVTLAVLEAVDALTDADVVTALTNRDLITADLQKAMSTFDVLITPTLAQAEIPFRYVDGVHPTLDEYLDRNDQIMPFSYLFNVSGWPALSIPVGTTDNGIPIGMQLAGPQGSERQLLDLAGQLHQL